MALSEKTKMLLYSTAACHLCEQAAAMLEQLVRARPGASFATVDVSDDDVLFDRYGWLIPVVRFADGTELNWPFNESELLQNFQAQ